MLLVIVLVPFSRVYISIKFRWNGGSYVRIYCVTGLAALFKYIMLMLDCRYSAGKLEMTYLPILI